VLQTAQGGNLDNNKVTDGSRQFESGAEVNVYEMEKRRLR